MFVAGTVTNRVKMMAMDSKWQLKKENLGKNRKENLTAEEMQLKQFQEEAERIRENKIPAAIDAKLKAGEKLTRDEIEYLKKHNPEALKEYEKIQAEREGFKRELRECESKEEVEKLKMTKMGEFLSQAKTTASDPYIPKSAKCGILEGILKRAAGIEKEYVKFIQSSMYASLPEEEEDDEKKKKRTDDEIKLENDKEDSVSDIDINAEDPLQEIKELALKFGSGSTSEGHAVDVKVGDDTVPASDSGSSGSSGDVSAVDVYA